MKPTLLPTANDRCSLIATPKTDFQFRPNSMADFAGRCHGNREPSFRGISRDYFQHEARGHFISEASMFVLMGATAAVTVIEGARVALAAFGLL